MSIPWRVVGPVAAVLLAGAAALVVSQNDPAPEDSGSQPPVAVSSDAPRYETLDELAGAADLVVRAHVTRTEHGRLFGDPTSANAVESRLVTLAVDQTLRGDDPGAGLLLEEEGWSADGAPLIVDGASPTERGDEAIWFLTEVEGPEGRTFITVSSVGRYLVEGGDLVGPESADPLAVELAALTPEALTARIAALAP